MVLDEQSLSVINLISNTRAPTEAFMRRNISQSSNLYGLGWARHDRAHDYSH